MSLRHGRYRQRSTLRTERDANDCAVALANDVRPHVPATCQWLVSPKIEFQPNFLHERGGIGCISDFRPYVPSVSPLSQKISQKSYLQRKMDAVKELQGTYDGL